MATSQNMTVDISSKVNSLIKEGKSLYKQAKLNESLKCFQRAADYISNQPENLIEVNLRISEILMDLGQVDDCIHLLDKTLKICQANFEEDHLILAKIYNFFSRPYRARRKSHISETLCQKALEINLKKLSPNEIEIARTYHNLGACAYDLDRYLDAKDWFDKALAIKEQYTGEDREFELGLAYQRLSDVNQALGNNEETHENLEQSLKCFKAYYNCHHPDINSLIDDLANFYLHVGSYEKAIKTYNELLESSLLLFGEKHPDVGRAYQGLGSAQNYLGHFELAEKNLLTALKIFKDILGEDDSDVAATCMLLSNVLCNQKKFILGLKYNYKALEINEKKSDRDSASEKSFGTFREIMIYVKSLEGALNHGLKALLIRRNLYGTEHQYYQNQFRGTKVIAQKIDLYCCSQSI